MKGFGKSEQVSIPLEKTRLKGMKNSNARTQFVTDGKLHQLERHCDLLRTIVELKGALSGPRQFLSTKSPLKIIKNGFFISHQKLSFFSRYLSFCFDFLVMHQNDLIKKIRLISNFMTLQPG